MNKLPVLVLAAGTSSRMKSVKQLLDIDSKTMLDIVLEKADKLAPNNTYCVLGAYADKIKSSIKNKNTTFLLNEKYNKGLSESIKLGVQFLDKNDINIDGVFILLADQPAIELSYLNAMKKLWHLSPKKIVASTYEKQIGVPAIFPKRYFDELKIIEGDKGAKKLLKSLKKEVILSDLTTNLVDLDTFEDYQKYVKNTN